MKYDGRYDRWDDNSGVRSTPMDAKQHPGLVYEQQQQQHDGQSQPWYSSSRATSTRDSSSEGWCECFCRHLKDFIVLAMVIAFFAFSGYICYYMISNYG